MSKKIDLPRKWASKKVTDYEEKAIYSLQAEMASKTGVPVTWLLAKHEYFEKHANQANQADPGKKAEKAKVGKEDAVKGKETGKDKTPRVILTIAESKLGATLVISKEDCKKLGYDNSKVTTKEVVKACREKLGLGV